MNLSGMTVISVLLCGYFTGSHNAAQNVKYEVVLENLTECPDPQPPFPAKRVTKYESNLYKHEGRTLIKGRMRILAEIPFQNFSVVSYLKKHGSERWEKKMFFEKMRCRSLMTQAFLTLGNYRYDKNTCRIYKGSFSYKDVDVDKVFHQIPSWHTEGKFMHQVSMTVDKKTVLCIETLTVIKIVN